MSRKTTKISKSARPIFAQIDTTQTEWARKHGYAITTVHQAVNFLRSGKKSLEIRKKLKLRRAEKELANA